ncbi:hypothetical protein [Prosthecobacter sp.]|uniref:hypothetical protein n=1 Tax=Prosthecobacter sp. TaxID=1965333 RepID=UPI003782E553
MEEQAKRLAKSIVLACVRNTSIEDLHTGKVARSETGDYSDVRVVTPHGDIPWKELSRISDDEMKSLMKEVVDKVYTVLASLDNADFMASLNKWGDRNTAAWDDPELLPNFVLGAKQGKAT